MKKEESKKKELDKPVVFNFTKSLPEGYKYVKLTIDTKGDLLCDILHFRKEYHWNVNWGSFMDEMFKIGGFVNIQDLIKGELEDNTIQNALIKIHEHELSLKN